METLVLKFGGASVATPSHFSQIATIILQRSLQARIVVVVSAMEGSTNQLLALAKEVHPSPPPREQDMLVSVGERISIALLAMALNLKGKAAISFTGSQSGIITTSTHSDALILDVKPHRILRALDQNNIVIVAGFQGVSQQGEITTLGRGGSDTTAVALAIALNASRAEFYKDVGGIYSVDPKLDPQAEFFPYLSFEEALSILDRGAKVLHPRCVRLASKNHLPLHVRSFYDPLLERHSGTIIGQEPRLRGGVAAFEEDARCGLFD